MKNIFLYLLVAATFKCFCQGYIDAGEQVVVCGEISIEDSIKLGGIPTVNGEYKAIKWTMKYISAGFVYNESFFLNNSRIENPILKNTTGHSDTVHVFLSVTDLNDSIHIDSTLIIFSIVGCLDGMDTYIKKGDSVRIEQDCESGHSPYSLIWSPNYNISDTLANRPLVWPEKNKTYICEVTDNVGCQFFAGATVIVEPNFVRNEYYNKIRSYPNPVENQLTIDFNNERSELIIIDIYNGEGKLIKQQFCNDEHLVVSTTKIKNGFYFFKVSSEIGIIGGGMFMK